MARYFCYRNLNKKGVVYSVRDMSTNLVEYHWPLVTLEDVTLKVSESGRKRVLRDKVKNVHAGVQGTSIAVYDLPPESLWRKATYNPYKYETFVDSGNENPVLKADYIILKEDGLWYSMKNWSNGENSLYYKASCTKLKDMKGLSIWAANL